MGGTHDVWRGTGKAEAVKLPGKALAEDIGGKLGPVALAVRGNRLPPDFGQEKRVHRHERSRDAIAVDLDLAAG